MKMLKENSLVISLTLNMILAAGLLAVGHIRRNAFATAVKTVAPKILDVKNVVADSGQTSSSTNSFNWDMIESRDNHQLVANLRAVGCPEETIGDIIVAKIDRLYETKSSYVSPDAPLPPPWENADHRRTDNIAHAVKWIEQQAEKRALISELLGYEWDDRLNKVWSEDRFTSLFLGFLPDSKASRLMTIYENYSGQGEIIKEKANNILIDEDHAQLQKLYDDMVAGVSQLLTSSEMEELELRVQAGIFLPDHDIHWDGVDISGAELREFVRLSRNYDNVFQNQFLGINPSLEERQLQKREFEAQVEALLGAARFKDYQRAQDYDFREALEFTKERNLPPAAAGKVYDARQSAENQADQIEQDASLSTEEQAEALVVLRAVTAGTISSVLGNNYNDYMNSHGQWLQNLAGSPAMAAK